MDWYIPITIIPGIGLIVISTTNIMLDLNAEISKLENSKDNLLSIIKAKLYQLKVINIAIVLQYLGILFFLISGIGLSISSSETIPQALLVFGVCWISFSILLLIYYSYKAISIHQKHLKI